MEEVCPRCGAVRPRWHGGSHHHVRTVRGGAYATRRCEDGVSPEDVWRTWDFAYMAAARGGVRAARRCGDELAAVPVS